MPVIVDCVADLARLERLARRLIARLRAGDIVALHGDLGTGKTTFVRAALRGLGWTSEVPSPTFTLAQAYDFEAIRVWHFDLYRLAEPQESIELGIDEAFTDGASFIEWPDRLAELLPTTRLDLELDFADEPDLRRLIMRGGADWARRLADLDAPE